LIVWEVEPSAENILLYMQEVLNSKLPSEIRLLQIKLYETKDSFAEWIADN
jgi:6-pyruvoyltetrahydropterin/6-carboxytetrahydropterin synthase